MCINIQHMQFMLTTRLLKQKTQVYPKVILNFRPWKGNNCFCLFWPKLLDLFYNNVWTGKTVIYSADFWVQVQYTVSGLNTYFSFTTAVSNSFLSPLEKKPIAADLG